MGTFRQPIAQLNVESTIKVAARRNISISFFLKFVMTWCDPQRKSMPFWRQHGEEFTKSQARLGAKRRNVKMEK